MPSTAKEGTPIKMKVFPKGQVVIPISLRKKYHIEIGDHIEIIPGEDGILLKPGRRRRADQASLTNQLFGIFQNYVRTKPLIKETEINKATESEFMKRWSK